MDVSHSNRAVVVLAAYDYEALNLTLNMLDITLDPNEKVVVILNGKRCFNGEMVERVARDWAIINQKNRHVIRPLCSGGDALFAIKEVLSTSSILKDVTYICKIDDDLIPLNKGWLDSLANCYKEQTLAGQNPAFTTGLINNNAWGFKQLVELFNKQEEYSYLMPSKSKSGTGIVHGGEIADGFCGTVWEYPYLAWWIHQWTSLSPEDFIEKTKGLSCKQIPADTHYSIGQMFFEKNFWLQLNTRKYFTTFDELLIHKHCQDQNLTKWAVMHEPAIHLFYYVQRVPNKDLIKLIAARLTHYFGQDSINKIQWQTEEEKIAALSEQVNSLELKLKRIEDSFLFNIFRKILKKIKERAS